MLMFPIQMNNMDIKQNTNEYFEFVQLCCWVEDQKVFNLIREKFKVVEEVVLDYDASTKLELLSNLYHPHIIEPTDTRVTTNSKITIFVIQLVNPKIEIMSRAEHKNKPMYSDLVSFKEFARTQGTNGVKPWVVLHAPDWLNEANHCFRVFNLTNYINKYKYFKSTDNLYVRGMELPSEKNKTITNNTDTYIHDHFYDFEQTMVDLEKQKIRYVVIRGFKKLPQTPDTDIDLVCHPDDYDKLHNIFLKRLSVIESRHTKINAKSCKYTQYKTNRLPRKDIANTYFHIDVYDSCFTFYIKKVLLPDIFLTTLFENRIKKDSYYIPSPDHEYFLLLMRIVLECKDIKPKHIERLNELEQTINKDELFKLVKFIENENIRDYFLSEVRSKKLIGGVYVNKEEVNINELLAIVWIDVAPAQDNKWTPGRFNLKKINDTPHFKFLNGETDEYSEYVSNIDKIHNVEEFKDLIESTKKDSIEKLLSNIVIEVEYWEIQRKYVIADGVHRLAILLSRGCETVNVRHINYQSVFKNKSEQCKHLLGNSDT